MQCFLLSSTFYENVWHAGVSKKKTKERKREREKERKKEREKDDVRERICERVEWCQSLVGERGKTKRLPTYRQKNTHTRAHVAVVPSQPIKLVCRRKANFKKKRFSF